MLAEVQENHETQEQVASMEAVLAAHRRRVYGVCRRRLGCEADAEDATQEVFRRYVEGVQTIRGDHGRWLVRCARNVCVDVVRSRRRRRLRERSRAAREGTSDEGMLVMETRELARFLLERLNPDDRELIRRHMMEGVPQKVLAAERGVSQQMVSRRVRDATGMMRRWVHEHVGTLSLGGLTTGFGAASSRAAVAVCTWLQRLPSPATWDLAVNKAVPAAGTIGLALMIPAATPPADNDTTPTGMGMASTGATWIAPFEPPAVGSNPDVQHLPGFHQSQAFGQIRVPTSQPRIASQARPSQSNRSDGVPSRPPKIEPPATLIPASETDRFAQPTTPTPPRSTTRSTPITVDASIRITPQRRAKQNNEAVDHRQAELSSPAGLIGRIELNSNEHNDFHPTQVAHEVFKRKLALTQSGFGKLPSRIDPDIRLRTLPLRLAASGGGRSDNLLFTASLAAVLSGDEAPENRIDLLASFENLGEDFTSFARLLDAAFSSKPDAVAIFQGEVIADDTAIALHEQAFATDEIVVDAFVPIRRDTDLVVARVDASGLGFAESLSGAGQIDLPNRIQTAAIEAMAPLALTRATEIATSFAIEAAEPAALLVASAQTDLIETRDIWSTTNRSAPAGDLSELMRRFRPIALPEPAAGMAIVAAGWLLARRRRVGNI